LRRSKREIEEIKLKGGGEPRKGDAGFLSKEGKEGSGFDFPKNLP